jgi:hypothetical protein
MNAKSCTRLRTGASSAAVILLLLTAMLGTGCTRVNRLPVWEERLQTHLAGATKLRVRSGGTCLRDKAGEVVLFEVKDPAAIANLLAQIRIKARGFRCGCCGNPTLEFYRGRRRIASVGFHHGTTLRWDGWETDVLLTADSAATLLAFLKRHGAADHDLDLKPEEAAPAAATPPREPGPATP